MGCSIGGKTRSLCGFAYHLIFYTFEWYEVTNRYPIDRDCRILSKINWPNESFCEIRFEIRSPFLFNHHLKYSNYHIFFYPTWSELSEFILLMILYSQIKNLKATNCYIYSQIIVLRSVKDERIFHKLSIWKYIIIGLYGIFTFKPKENGWSGSGYFGKSLYKTGINLHFSNIYPYTIPFKNKQKNFNSSQIVVRYKKTTFFRVVFLLLNLQFSL